MSYEMYLRIDWLLIVKPKLNISDAKLCAYTWSREGFFRKPGVTYFAEIQSDKRDEPLSRRVYYTRRARPIEP